MPKFRLFMAVLFLLVPVLAFAQSADQQFVSVVDSPDPVTPGNNITYTVTITNNGPDPAVNGGMNANLSGTLNFVSASGPAGFTCANFGNSISCTNPSWAPGAPAVFTVIGQLPSSLNAFPDGSVTSTFSTSGVTPDPNNGNNNGSATTNYDSPQAEISIGVVDSPDPVFPDGDITYTVTVTNGGPQAAMNTNLNVPLNNTLLVTSVTAPAGWNCGTITPGQGTSFTCSNPSASVGTHVFTIVLRANDEQFGINDGTINQFFGVNSAVYDSNNGNNGVTVSTAYVTPDANIAVTASDSPDPVFPDGDITYTVTVTNAGPDTAPNVTLNVPLNNTLRVTSVTAPAGWNCGTITPGQGTSFSCTNPSFANGGNAVFTIVLRANDEQFGITDQTINQFFGANSSISDPNNANNSVTVSTQYVTPDANIGITASDSPDPVFPDGDITYTVTVTNAGPDTAPNTVLNVPLNNTLRVTSVTAPAGWNCGTITPGQGTSFSCTNPSFANGGNAVFTIVLRANDEQFGIFDQTINQFFGANSSVSDPNNANNSVTVSTQYTTPDANLGISGTDAPDPVTPPGNITYSITATNAGPDAATNTQVTMGLASGTTFVSLAAPAGWSCTTPAVGAHGLVTCTNTSFAVTTANFTLVAQTNASLLNGPDGTLQATLGISSAVADPVNANNSQTVMTAYVTPDADISVTNADAPDPVTTGATITYAQTLTNNGPDTATSVTFNQSVPAGTTFVSLASAPGWSCTTPAVGGTGAINCSIASLASGGTGSFTLIVTVTAPSGTIQSTVTGDSATYDPDPTDDQAIAATTIQSVSADLSINKTTVATSAARNANIIYTINVNNNGPSAATNVVMTDVLPASLLFQSITPPAGFNCTTPAVGSTGTITCTAATLANGATATFSLTLRVASNASGTVTNSASVSSATSDPNGGNSSGSTPPIPAVAGAGEDIPTMSQWMLIAMAAVLALAALTKLRL